MGWSHQIRRVTSDPVNKCDAPPTDHSSGSMMTALKYADIKGYDVPQGKIVMESKEDWDKCAQKCSARSDCHAWTFHWGDKTCYLKGNPAFCPEEIGGPWVKNEATISGGHNVLPYKDGAINNAESGGDPISKYPDGIRGMGWQKCQQLCGTETGCTSWTYKYSTEWCWIKEHNVQNAPWDYDPDTISGPNPAGASLLSHQIRRVTSDPVNKCDAPPTDHSSGSMMTALKYADIKGYDVPQGKIEMESKEDWDKCAQNCSARRDCHAWTFHWGDKTCYLKANPAFCPEEIGGPWVKNQGTISGGHNLLPYKDGAINNAESGGDPISKYPDGIKGMGWQKCQQLCGTETACTSWTYKYSTEWCWIKEHNVQNAPWDYDPDTISGPR